LGEGDKPTWTSVAKRFAQLRKNAADDNTILRMSAYATPCPRFRKINLTRHWNRPGDGAALAAASASKFCFLKNASAI
jgi:hypothetical protein